MSKTKKIPAQVKKQLRRVTEEVNNYTDTDATLKILSGKGFPEGDMIRLYLKEVFSIPPADGEVLRKSLELISQKSSDDAEDGTEEDDAYSDAVTNVMYAYITLAIGFASDYNGLGFDWLFADFITDASIGLQRAIKEYHSVSHKYDFTEYAALHMRHALTECINCWLSRPIPVPYYDLINDIRDSAERLGANFENPDDVRAVAEDVGCSGAAAQTVLIYFERGKRSDMISSDERMTDFDPEDYR